MPRQRSPDSKKAETLYRKGFKTADIAERLGVPAGTVRRWKAEQEWDKVQTVQRSVKRSDNEHKTSTQNEQKTSRRKKGGQPGNVNAVGKECGGLPRNKNAEKHGAYSRIYWDSLDSEEVEMMEDAPEDIEQLLIKQIRLFDIRERRIMLAIKKYRDMKDANGRDVPVSIAYTQRSEHKRVFDGSPEEIAEQEMEYKRLIEEKIENKERMPGRDVAILTHTENKDDIILRLERELSTVQSKKTAAIQALAKYQLEKQKLDGESQGNDFVRTWAEAVLKERSRSDG